MSIPLRIMAGSLIVLSTAAAIYLTQVNQRQLANIADLQTQLSALRKSELRAIRDAVDARREAVDALAKAAAMPPPSMAEAASPAAALPAVVTVTGGGAVNTATGEVVAFRTEKLSSEALRVLPTPEMFETMYFSPDRSIATAAQLGRATEGLIQKSGEVEGFMSTHGLLQESLGALHSISELLTKDTGTDAAISAGLRQQYVESVQRTLARARNIGNRPTEQPDAQEVAKQIAALADVISKRALGE